MQQPVSDTHRRHTEARWLRPWPSRRRQDKELLWPTLAKLQGWLSLCADASTCKWLLEANGKGLVVSVHILKGGKTHKKQIMPSISKVVKILGRCFLCAAGAGGHTRWFPGFPVGLHLLPQGVWTVFKGPAVWEPLPRRVVVRTVCVRWGVENRASTLQVLSKS